MTPARSDGAAGEPQHLEIDGLPWCHGLGKDSHETNLAVRSAARRLHSAVESDRSGGLLEPRRPPDLAVVANAQASHDRIASGDLRG